MLCLGEMESFSEETLKTGEAETQLDTKATEAGPRATKTHSTPGCVDGCKDDLETALDRELDSAPAVNLAEMKLFLVDLIAISQGSLPVHQVSGS